MNRNNKLVMDALAEAVPYARTCSNGRLPDDELTSICYEAMMKCAKKYDPKRGKFFSYCKARIRGALLRHWSVAGAVVKNAECVPFNTGRVDTSPASKELTLPGEFTEPDDGGMFVEPDFERIDFHERWNQISGILARVCSDREHALIQLVYSMNFTFAEAGKRFNISRQAAQVIVAKVIDRVKEQLGLVV